GRGAAGALYDVGTASSQRVSRDAVIGVTHEGGAQGLVTFRGITVLDLVEGQVERRAAMAARGPAVRQLLQDGVAFVDPPLTNETHRGAVARFVAIGAIFCGCFRLSPVRGRPRVVA